MTKKQALQLFEERKVRTVWDSEQEKWYFSVVDVVAILTESSNPQAYWRKWEMKRLQIVTSWRCKPRTAEDAEEITE